MKICSKLATKTPERRQWCGFGGFIANFEHISHLVPAGFFVNFEQVNAGFIKIVLSNIKIREEIKICDS